MIWTHPVKKAWRKWLHLWTSWLVYPKELGAILIPGSWISKENRAETGLKQDCETGLNRSETGLKQGWNRAEQDWNRTETRLNRTETELKQDWKRQNWNKNWNRIVQCMLICMMYCVMTYQGRWKKMKQWWVPEKFPTCYTMLLSCISSVKWHFKPMKICCNRK